MFRPFAPSYSSTIKYKYKKSFVKAYFPKKQRAVFSQKTPRFYRGV